MLLFKNKAHLQGFSPAAFYIHHKIIFGILLALLSFTGFASVNTIAKHVSATGIPGSEYAFFVALFALLPTGVFIKQQGGLQSIKPKNIYAVAGRGILAGVSALCGFMAFSVLPLSEAYAIIFMIPVFVTILSVPLLGESVGWRRTLAVLTGFIGILIILQPTEISLSWGHVAALCVAISSAFAMIILRKAGGKEKRGAFLLSSVLGVLLLSFPMAIANFVPPSLEQLGFMLLGGLLMGGAQTAIIFAMRILPATLVTSFQYSEMIWAILFGALLFGEAPTLAVLIGASIVIGSGIYTLCRETFLKRAKS